MEELIKVASNGQWILEKAKMSREEIERAIAQFQAAKQKAASTPVPPRKQSTEGLRPVAPVNGENPLYSKEQVAAMRAGLPQNFDEKALAEKKAQMPKRDKEVDESRSKLDTEQSKAEEKAKIAQNRKAAWEATTKFLGQKGGEVKDDVAAMGRGYGYGTATGGENKGWASINQKLQQDKLLDQARTTGVVPDALKPKQKQELMPPMEMIRDAQGNASMQMRRGKFHGEGATTRGKIVHSPVAYEDKQTGEKRYTNVPQQEVHHWGWDAQKNKWNHIRTARVPTSST